MSGVLGNPEEMGLTNKIVARRRESENGGG